MTRTLLVALALASTDALAAGPATPLGLWSDGPEELVDHGPSAVELADPAETAIRERGPSRGRTVTRTRTGPRGGTATATRTATRSSARPGTRTVDRDVTWQGPRGRTVTVDGAPRTSHAPEASRRPGGPRPVPTVGGARPGSPVVGPRPGGAVVHGPRPGGTVVHGPRPGGTVVAGARPAYGGRPVVVHGARPVTRVYGYGRPGPRYVTYSRVRPYHGVFVYGPRPVTHVTYVRGGSAPQRVPKADLPVREVDRNEALAVGLMAGSMISSTPGGEVYGDPGLALVGRYRPAEMVGLELGLGHHNGAFSPEEVRSQTNLNGQVKLFAFPWSRVSPYALGGVTYNAANLQSEILSGDTAAIATTKDAQWGLDGGLGLELALGKSLAIDLEGKYIGWMDERLPGEAPGALQLGGGLAVHFK